MKGILPLYHNHHHDDAGVHIHRGGLTQCTVYRPYPLLDLPTRLGRHEYGGSLSHDVPTRPQGDRTEDHLRCPPWLYAHIQLDHRAQVHRNENNRRRSGCPCCRGLDCLTGGGSQWRKYCRYRCGVLGLDAASCAYSHHQQTGKQYVAHSGIIRSSLFIRQ